MALGLSQEELASRATFERKSVSRVENGSYAPSLDRLWRLADALDVPLHTLLRAAEVERIGRR